MTIPAPILVDLFAFLDLRGIRRGRIHRQHAKRAYESPDDFHALFCPRIGFGQIPYRPAEMIPLGSTGKTYRKKFSAVWHERLLDWLRMRSLRLTSRVIQLTVAIVLDDFEGWIFLEIVSLPQR